MSQARQTTRRRFLQTTAAGAATFTIVPRHVLGRDQTPPSETLTYATVGNGRRADSGIGCAGDRKKIAVCDVDTKHLGGEPDNKSRYTDFRKLLERKDLDVVCIATPPHWHALIGIAAAEAGKHIFCEKPMTKFIAEGRAVADAVEKAGVAFQIGTFGRYKRRGSHPYVVNHQIVKHGLVKDLSGIVAYTGAKNRTGKTDLTEQPVPASLDYEMWLGPAPYKPYNAARVHYSNRFYWDYEGGDLTNFGAHSFDPFQWTFAKDDTAPVKAMPSAPWPQHPDAVGHYGWVELTYADGLKVVVTGGGWKDGPKYETSAKQRMLSADDLDEAGRQKLAELPEPERMLGFGDAVRQGKQSGGHAESSHRVCTALHLANIAIRMGRTIHFDPETEQITGDEQANRLVNIPMRAPWHL